MKSGYPILLLCLFIIGCHPASNSPNPAPSCGNPLFPGWYADPEGIVFGDTYWIFPTFSAAYEQQVFLDAFSSRDLVHWEKHTHVIDTSLIKWAKMAMWAPAAIEKNGKYYLFFSANDIQKPGTDGWDNPLSRTGGIGVAMAEHPEGPYHDLLGKPLISTFHNGAQPIDQFVFRDSDSAYYMIYGGWGHCNIGRLNGEFTGFTAWDDGKMFREITPEGYVEGPFVFIRNKKYYFMWSEGGWTNGSYTVAYAMADKITGPFRRIGTILQSDSTIATGAGHNSVINTPGTDSWFMVYHRRPIPNEGRDHRVTCMDKLLFNEDGTIQPVIMTFEGVGENEVPAMPR
jgi:beta-xylosidase